MKNILLSSIFAFFSFVAFSQNVKVEAQIIEVQRSNYSDGFGYGDPDPSWIVSGYIGGVNQGTSTLTYEEMSGTNWSIGYNGCDGPVPCHIVNNSNTSSTTFVLGLDAWDNDCNPMDVFNGPCNWPINNNDYKRCTNNSLSTVSFRTAGAFCVASNTSGWTEGWSNWCGDYRVKYAYRWSFASAPTITTQPLANTSLCLGSTTTLSVSVNSDATSGISLGQHYQWQVSNNTDCSGAANWQDIPGATSASYTPPQIAGTRLYRVKITSNCTANFSTQTTTSNCARVSYNPMNGTTSGVTAGFPYGTGDNAPAIQSGVCGNTVLPGTTHVLNTLQPPAVGAIANISSYSWAVSGGGSLSSTTGSSVTFTAPTTPGTSTITLTYIDACGVANASVVCIIQTGSPACDFIYVSPSGSDNINCGGPDNPCRTLSSTNGALAKVSASRNYVKMAVGSYTEPNIVSLSTGVIIEGRYTISGGLWTKASTTAASTSISCTAEQTINNDVAHRIGFVADSDNNWKLIDLNISTTAATGQTVSGRGKSNYAIWINNSSGYEITRCNITSGSASNGADGANGSNGASGGSGGQGLTDSCNDDDFLNGGAGGAGGNNAWGGNGGSGGRGGNAAGQSKRSRGCNGSAGGNTNVSGGAGGTSPGTPCQNNYDSGNSNGDATNDNAVAGNLGSPNHVAGVRGTSNHTYAAYFTPSSQATQGGHGSGGGGGSGGGSSGGEKCTFCNNNYGNSGGGGGGGGGGGQGGFGGFGGGSSFAIYSNNSNSGAVISLNTLSAGTGGLGGSGGVGGSGGAGGSAGAGNGSCSGDRRTSAAGASGRSGGNGGRGQDAANGFSYQMYVVGVGSSTPSVTVPNGTTVAIEYKNAKICQNSVLTMSKSAGSWGLPSGFDYVKYNQTGITSEFGVASSPTDVYTTGAVGSYNLSANGQVFNSYLTVKTTRTAPVITIQANDGTALSPARTICNGGTVKLTASASGSVQQEFKWEIFDNATQAPNKGLATGLVFSSTAQSPVSDPLVNTGTTDKIYTVRYQVRDECCGWSIPVFETIIVKPDPTAPTALVQSPTNNDVCVGQTLTVSSPSGALYGITPYTYEYAYDNASTSGSYNTSIPSFAAAEGDNNVFVRIAEDALRGCDASPAYEVDWTGYKDPVAGYVSRVSPSTEEVCVGTSISVQVSGADGGVPSTTTDVIQYYLVTPSGGAAPSAATAGTTYSGAITAAVGDYYFRTQRTSTGSHCDASSWSAWSKTYVIYDNPDAGTTASDQTLCLNENATAVSLTGNNAGVTSWEIDNNTAFSSPAVITTTSTTLAGTYIDSEIGSSTNTRLYVRAVVNNNVCPEAKSDSVIVRYNQPDPLVMADATGDCIANFAGTWVNIYDPNTDRLICAVNDNGQNLGTVTASVYYHSGNSFNVPVYSGACGTQAVMNRNFVINSANAINASIPVGIRLYFTNAELADLIDNSLTSHSTGGSLNYANHDPNGCEDDDDVLNIGDLFVTQIHSAATEDGTFTLNDGVSLLHTPANSGIGNAHFGGNYVQFNVTQFSEFWIHGSEHNVPLPVELVEFEAKAINNQFIQLNWTTATEINNAGFEIERSLDGFTFEKIGWADGYNNSNEMHYYSYQDNEVEKGVYYYRLKQIDNDGAFEYSEIRAAAITGNNKDAVSFFIPNPAENSSKLNLVLVQNEAVSIQLYNNIGQIVDSKENKMDAGVHDVIFDTSNLPSGTYMAHIKVGNEVYQRKLVIAK